MATNDPAAGLQGRALRAYERGRLRWSLRFALPIFAAVAAAVACGRPPEVSCAIGLALLPLAVGAMYAGGNAARGVRPGLVGGFAALALPLLVRSLGHVCLGPACMALCLPAAVVGGVIAGVVIANAAREDGAVPVIAVALAIAAPLGALGCAMSGAAGVLGMLAGTVMGGAPVLVAARRAP